MSVSIKEQTPATTNQIQHERPNIKKSYNILQGYFANSQNGGIIKPFAYAPIMAGTETIERRLQGRIKMLTPKTPVFQKLVATIDTYFVPNSAIWKNQEKFIAQKGGASETKIKKVPNLYQKTMPAVKTENIDIDVVNFTDTDLWRDSWLSTYIPRYQTGANSMQTITLPMPEYSELPLRGFVKIYNDFLRNKEYDEELILTDGDSANDFIPDNPWDVFYDRLYLRGKRQNSYYTDYRTELLGFDGTEPALTGTNDLPELVEWEKTVASARAQAQNAQRNDWDILAELYGSKLLTEGKVQHLSRKVIPLNYQAVAQTTYNTNQDIEESFQSLGEQGAYSYTEFDVPIIQMTKFNEFGYIHCIMQISADTVYETGFERTGLNVNWDDMYRPDLKELKDDVLYEIETCGTRLNSMEDFKKIKGFKRKFSEYFKLPDCISGDLCTRGYYITKQQSLGEDAPNEFIVGEELTRTESKRSFQFFEIDDKETADFRKKNPWQDYTDILINENQAIRQEVEEINTTGLGGQKTNLRVKGDNQIFYIGIQTAIEYLPIDENIKSNFTKFGEK